MKTRKRTRTWSLWTAQPAMDRQVPILELATSVEEQHKSRLFPGSALLWFLNA